MQVVRQYNHRRPKLSLCQELIILKKKSLCERSQLVKRDIVTADIYYITTDVTLAFQHLEVLCYNGVNLEKFAGMGENVNSVNRHFSRNFDIFTIKNDLPQGLSCYLAFQPDPKPFKRVIGAF